MSTDENPFAELIEDYIVECLPLAEQVGDACIELERRWRSGDPADDLLPALKGRLHTVKGNSAMMGLAPMETVAHALEDVCALLDAEPDLAGDEVAGLLVRGSGLLIDLIRHAAGEPNPKPAAQFVKRVRKFSSATAARRAHPGLDWCSSAGAVRVAIPRLASGPTAPTTWCGWTSAGSMPCSRYWEKE